MSRICPKVLIAALAAAACIALAPAQTAYAIDYHWIGAGTGGNTATDPADPTTQWNNPANWQEGAVPGAGDFAVLTLNNAGYVNAPCAMVGGFRMDGLSQDGALYVGDGADFATSGAWNVLVGCYGQGRVLQTGGAFTANVGFTVGYKGGGTYLLQGGTLTVARIPPST
jgi:hypothetical protein